MSSWKIDPSISILNSPIRSGVFRSTEKVEDSFTVTLVRTVIGEVPLEDYYYCQLDMRKWNDVWKNDDNYIDEYLRTPNVYSWSGEYDKSMSKLSRLLDGILYSGYIMAPVLGTRISNVGQGRHRICLMRKLGFESFVAAIPARMVGDSELFLTSLLPNPIPKAIYNGLEGRH